MSYIGKSNGLAEAKVASGPSGPPEILLGNPNTTSVTGTLYLKSGADAFFVTKFTVEPSGLTPLELRKPLAENQYLYLVLDAAPAAQITIWS